VRELTREEQSGVNDLCFHWDEAYRIFFDGETYVAHRIGYPELLLTAEGTAELRQLIRADYHAWQSSLVERSSL
jgi:hypothetical protein